MDDGQKTPREHPDFNTYNKNQCVLVFQTDRQTDGRTETLTRGGFPHYVPPGKDSFTPYPSLSPYTPADGQTEKQINPGWAG
jgi:hypothetical protein